MKRRDLAAVALAAALAPCRVWAHETKLSPQIAAFIAQMSERHGFDAAELEQLFSGFRENKKVIELIKPPEKGGRQVWWDEYRERHLTIRKISGGVLFMKSHAGHLAAAAERYGVPAEIITAILGVETRYGTYTGKFRTLEALATLAFHYPPRADYFRGELEQLLLYARSSGVKISDLEGSYAGAMGYPQFMPTSARTWAVDFDRDGDTDLFSFADAIGSVANFLVEHGWLRGAPVAFPVTPGPAADPGRLLEAGIVPDLDAADFSAADMAIDFGAGEQYRGKLALVDLENEDETVYRAGTVNYYVITRYNRSNKYAMTVLDLAQEIAARS